MSCRIVLVLVAAYTSACEGINAWPLHQSKIYPEVRGASGTSKTEQHAQPDQTLDNSNLSDVEAGRHIESDGIIEATAPFPAVVGSGRHGPAFVISTSYQNSRSVSELTPLRYQERVENNDRVHLPRDIWRVSGRSRKDVVCVAVLIMIMLAWFLSGFAYYQHN